MLKPRFVWIAGALLLTILGGCNGSNGYGPAEPLLPTTDPRSEGVTVVMGRPGDRWLDMMAFLQVERASHDGQHGYEITYAAPGGGSFSLFWSRDRIDLGGSLPPQQRMDLPIGNGNFLYYPYTLTAESLPKVFPAIQIIEQSYAREADGWITAAPWTTFSSSGETSQTDMASRSTSRPFPGFSSVYPLTASTGRGWKSRDSAAHRRGAGKV